jgi:hypothetical protein
MCTPAGRRSISWLRAERGARPPTGGRGGIKQAGRACHRTHHRISRGHLLARQHTARAPETQLLPPPSSLPSSCHAAPSSRPRCRVPMHRGTAPPCHAAMAALCALNNENNRKTLCKQHLMSFSAADEHCGQSTGDRADACSRRARGSRLPALLHQSSDSICKARNARTKMNMASRAMLEGRR